LVKNSVAQEMHRSKLSTFAVVEAQLTRGLKNPTDYLLPFFQEIIGRKDGKVFAVSEVVEEILEEYALDIPVYLADSLVPSLVKEGYLEFDRDHRCHICHKVNGEASDHSLDDVDFNVIERSLAKYASERDIAKPLAANDWIKALLAFFAQKEQKTKLAKSGDRIVANPKEQDDRVVSKFIVHCESYEPDVFAKIKVVYTAFSIADTVSYIQNMGHLEDWDTLNLVYDATVLMRLLGTSGTLLKRATIEMHSMLQDIGCRVFYFDHTLAEVYSNLDAIVSRYSQGEPIHRETAQALENGEVSITTVGLLKANADIQLGTLNITQKEIPPRISQVAHQVDPLELEGFLKSSINYRSNAAASIDAESIEKLVFLRKGKKSTDLPRCGHIFVTHNARYARVSKRYANDYCGYNNFDTPPIVTLGTLTKLAWLASDKQLPDLNLTQGLLTNCFQASLPDDRWYNKFWKSIENTHPELLDVDIHDSLYLLDVRQAAEEASLGNSALFDDIDLEILIANAKQARKDREIKHEADMQKLTEERDLVIRQNQNKIAALQKQHESELEVKHQETQKEIAYTKDEAELTKQAEIDNIRQQHSQDIQEKSEKAKQDLQDSIEAGIKNKANTQAKIISKVLTIALAGVFALLFFISQSEHIKALLPSEATNTIKWITATLGVIQIVGLFVDKFSFLFLGPKLAESISTKLENHYRAIASIDKLDS